jgi:hypothetical protein
LVVTAARSHVETAGGSQTVGAAMALSQLVAAYQAAPIIYLSNRREKKT